MRSMTGLVNCKTAILTLQEGTAQRKNNITSVTKSTEKRTKNKQQKHREVNMEPTRKQTGQPTRKQTGNPTPPYATGQKSVINSKNHPNRADFHRLRFLSTCAGFALFL